MLSAYDFQDSFQSLGVFCAKIFIIFGGAASYVPQYVEIDRTGNANGFSIYVSMAVVFSCCLKICLWFVLHFDNALLIQCFVMILMMTGMIELRIRVLNRDHEVSFAEQRNFLDWSLDYFWDWTNMLSYVQAMVVFTLSSAFIILFFGWIPEVPTVVSIVAVVLDAVIALPQFLNNIRNGSTSGMSEIMIYCWTLGDLFKILYMATRNVPVSFIMCACFQFCLDLAILAQLLYYH